MLNFSPPFPALYPSTGAAGDREWWSSVLLLPSYILTLLHHGFVHGLQSFENCSSMDSPWDAVLQDKPVSVCELFHRSHTLPSINIQLLQHRVLHGLQRNICSGIWSTSSSSFSNFGVCTAVSHLFSLFLCLCGIFCPSLENIFPEASLSRLLGSVIPCGGFIGDNWNWLCPAQGSFSS